MEIQHADKISGFSGYQQALNLVRFHQLYGLNGQGTGRMPGFGALLTDEQITAVVEYVRSL